MSFIAILIGWLGIISANLVWIGHGIYQLVTTNFGFFDILFTNGFFWLIQMVVSLIILFVGIGSAENKLKK